MDSELTRLFKTDEGMPVPIIIAIAGGAGTGKSSTGTVLAANFRALGFAAICIPSGIVFRLFAALALQAASPDKAATDFSASELVRLAETLGVSLSPFRTVIVGHDHISLDQLKTPSIDAIVGRWGNDPETATFVKALISQLATSFPGIVVIEGRSVCVDYADIARVRVTLQSPPALASIRSGQPIERIISRDAQDMTSGALPKVPVGLVLNVDWYPRVDAVASEIMSRLLLASRGDLARLFAGWLQGAIPHVSIAGISPEPDPSE